MPNRLAYCTNVHPGRDLKTTQDALTEHAVQVKSRFSPDQPMGIGLWLSAEPAEELLTQTERLSEFRQWLSDQGLVACTWNGFPYGDFHEPVVKHRVYQPTWWQAERSQYTCNLAKLLDAILPQGESGTISTLPLGWPTGDDDSNLAAAAEQLESVVEFLERLHQEQGRRIVLCLEPEPGCLLDSSDDVVDFFETQLYPRKPQDWWVPYLGVCHDVCHSAVMFEPQRAALNTYRRAGIAIGKVQISSAVKMDLATKSTEEKQNAVKELAAFAEDRYLHQTMWQDADGEQEFFEDLTLALQTAGGLSQAEWRTHFHVPIYLKDFGHLETTQDEIDGFLADLEDEEVLHFEVETYAWSVLPEELQQESLAEGIAREMAWAKVRLKDKIC